MKIILRADVENLGRLGDVVTVKAGLWPQLPVASGPGHAGHPR